MGSHLIIGLVDDSGKVIRFGFYPREPSGKRKKAASEGPGYVKRGDTPASGGTGRVYDITGEQYRKLMAVIEADIAARAKGKGKEYSLDDYNCVDWADSMISTAFGGPTFKEGGYRRGLSEPGRFLEWFPPEEYRMPVLGDWKPGDDKFPGGAP